MTTIEIPDHLAPALSLIVNSYVQKGGSYGNATSFGGMFETQAGHLSVHPRDIADVFELTKLSRLREIRGQVAAGEPLFEQYRDKAVFAVIALGLFLDSPAGAGVAPAKTATTKGVMHTGYGRHTDDRHTEEHVQTAALGEVLLMLQTIAQQITRVDRKVNALMGTQEDIDAAVQAIQTENQAVADALGQLGTATQQLTDAQAALQAEITSLQTANPSVDTSGLTAAVSQFDATGLNDAVSGLAGAVQNVASMAPADGSTGTTG